MHGTIPPRSSAPPGRSDSNRRIPLPPQNDFEGIDDSASVDDHSSISGSEVGRKSVRIGPRSVARSVTGSVYSDQTKLSGKARTAASGSIVGGRSVGAPRSILKKGPRSVTSDVRSNVDDNYGNRSDSDSGSVSSSDSSKLSSARGGSSIAGSAVYQSSSSSQSRGAAAKSVTGKSISGAKSVAGRSIAGESRKTGSKSVRSRKSGGGDERGSGGRPQSRESDHSSVSSGSSRGSLSSRRGPPKDGPCLSGAFFGIPKKPDTQGSVLISGDAGEFWIRIRDFGCYNVSKEDFDKTFFFFSTSRSPTTINPAIAVRMLTPTYVVDEGSIPPPPPRDANGNLMTTDMNFCLADCMNQRTKRAVDPRKFQSLVVAVVKNAGEPAVVLGCANLADALNDQAEKMADQVDKMRRRSLELQTFGKKVVQQQTIYGKTYQEMDSVATDCFATLGKTKTKGSLTFGEFKLILAVLGVSFTEARAYLWFDKADADGSGEIEFLEFQHLLTLSCAK